MIESQLYVPSFRNKHNVMRTLFFLLLGGIFLAVFEVGMSNGDHGRTLWTACYFHTFFLVSSGLLVMLVLELFRSLIESLPRSRAIWLVWLLTVVTVCIATVWVNLVHAVTHMQAWQNDKLIVQFFFHGFLSTVVVGICLHYVELQQRLVKTHSADLRNQVYNLESRMQPHFFFNSLNTLLYLVEMQDDRAPRLIEDMSAFFRTSLRPPQMVNLKDEIDICRRYLQIEGVRLPDQFSVSWGIENEYDLYLPKVPSLSIQPIFEFLITEGAQYAVMDMQVHVCLLESSQSKKVDIQWEIPRIENETYVGALQTLLGNVRMQLSAHFSDVQVDLQTVKQKHTIGLIYLANSV